MVITSAWFKRAVAVLAAVVAAAVMLPGATHAAPEDAVTIPDAALRAELLAEADGGDGTLTEGELAALTGTLDLSGVGIYDITGLEYLAGVTELDLSDNYISDISPLAGLALTGLNVSGNYLYITDSSQAMTVIDGLSSTEPYCSVIYLPQKDIPANGVSLDRTSFAGCVGDTVTLNVTVSPAGAAEKGVTWSSENDEIVSVDGGAITLLEVGTVEITATTVDGGFTASCTVNVKGDKLASTKYVAVDGLLTGVAKSTAIPVFKSYFGNDETDIKVYKAAGGEITAGLAGTGMTVKLFVRGIERDALTVIVLGDANGDGNISISDYTLARLDILGLKALEGHYRTAADVNQDGSISISDYTLMRLDILGLKPIGGGLPDIPDDSAPKVQNFINIALAQQGKPYVWGAEGPNSFDCSGLVHYCLNQAGHSVGRSTADTYSKRTSWQRVEKNELVPGDLMFYFSDKPGDTTRIGHTGIYLGNGYHIHASSSNGFVIISEFKGWYDKQFSHGRRVNF